MQCKLLSKNGHLEVDIAVSRNQSAQYKTIQSDIIKIYGLFNFQAKEISYLDKSYGCYNNIVSVCFYCVDDQEKCKYKIKLACSEFKLKDLIFYSDENHWHIIDENKESSNYTFKLFLQLECMMQLNFFDLYDDEQLTDFQLKAKDGAVSVHKAYLAAASAFFKSNLINDAKDNILDVPGTSLKTLQDFKRCVYQDIMPDNKLEDLLLVISFFKIKLLEYKCVNKLLTKMGSDAGAVINIFDFSLKHRHMPLLLGIIEYFQSGIIDIGEVRKYYLKAII